MAGLKRIEFRGHTFNQRTIDMIKEAERNLKNLLGNSFAIEITQGSYTTAVPDSALTHKGGGVADIRAKNLSPAQRDAYVFELRRVGFAAWLRGVHDNFDTIHIHAVALRDAELSEGSEGAVPQVTEYLAGGDGLAGNAKDRGPRDFVGRTWEQYKALRAIKDVTPDAKEAEKKADVHLSIRALRKAAKGEPISHTFRFDAEKFIAFASSGLGVVTKAMAVDWRRTRDQKLFVAAVKAVQKRLHLLEDGDPGPITLGRIERFGYFSTP